MTAAKHKPHVLFVVTTSMSCGFYRGALRYLGDSGFSTTMVSAPGKLLNEVSFPEGAASVAIPMEREIRSFQDLVSLWKLYRALRTARPDVVDVSTPKAGLLGSVAAFLARVLAGCTRCAGCGWKRPPGSSEPYCGQPNGLRAGARIGWFVLVRVCGSALSAST
jgi:hypothetical protein